MAITTSVGVPAVFRAGDTTPWTVYYGDYPADESWALKYYFKREGHETVEVDATASGTSFAVTMTEAESGQFAAGRWSWYARATKTGTGSIVADTGHVDVLPDPEGEVERSFSEQALEMVEASIRGDLPTAQESISVAGVDVTKMSISERFVLRDRIKAEVSRERQRRRLAAGMENKKGIQVRFI